MFRVNLKILKKLHGDFVDLPANHEIYENSSMQISISVLPLKIL